MLTFPFPALPALLAAWLAQTHAVMAQSPSIAEGGVPSLAKSAYLSDLDIRRIARHTERLRAAGTVRQIDTLYRPELRAEMAVAA